ncbi:hypothetical protein D3C84_652110 [compost metagenome]
MGGDKSQDQHAQAYQAEQAGDQQCAIVGQLLALVDVLKGALVSVEEVIAQHAESFTQRLLGAQTTCRNRGVAKSLKVALIMTLGVGEVFTGIVIALLVEAFVQQALELRLQALKRLQICWLVEHQRQLLTEVLPQFQAQIEGRGVFADQGLLRPGHLQDADQA